MSKRILILSLKKVWFTMMADGKKTDEFRKPSDWIKSRLIGREYDQIKFINGYGSKKPYFICEYKGFDIAQEGFVIAYGCKMVEVDGIPTPRGGHPVLVEKGDFIIHLGKIIETNVKKT